MDPQRLQNDLESMYSSWKTNIKFSEDHSRSLGSPFLIHVTDDYCYAEKRILSIGQETLYWGFYDEKTQAAFLRTSKSRMMTVYGQCRILRKLATL
jgi:hypothetical protein